MPEYTQDKRPIAVDTPLGKDVLLLTSFTGQEEFSRLFRYDLEFLSERKSIAPTDIVGKNISFFVRFPDGEPRQFNGFVRRFAYCGTSDRLSIFRAEVVPWLWFLTRTSDCRIFQEKTVPEIIEQIFNDLGFKDFDKSGITQSHKKWEYCVQYRETDFNFVSRLMEQEGIFYFFKHEKGKHTLMLADGKSAYKDLRDKEVQFAANLSGPDLLDQVDSWVHQYEYRSGKWAHTDYNFKDPATDLMAKTKGVVELNSPYEFYDYPGEYEVRGDGDADVKLRMEEEEAAYDVVNGECHCRSFNPGGKFKLTKHHSSNEAGKGYVVTSVRHTAHGGAYITGGSEMEDIYRNTFTCIPDSVTFRPERLTPKPSVQGVHTALVVGPSGEEIYTDEYGRVKVQFYWDREGKKDEKSSCWIRCAQTAAGKGWGAMMLPRIGQEVVVTYLDGDPDRPLITGVVYNAGQLPPYKLPDEKTKSYFKSNSSKGGEGFNEIRFEDKASEEQIYMHAQKDLDLRILNDRREIVLGKHSMIISGDGSGSDAGDQVEKVKKDKHITVEGKKQEKIDGDSLLLIGGESHIVNDKGRKEKIAKDLNLTVGGAVNQQVANQVSLKAKGYHAKLDNDLAYDASTIHIKAGMMLVLEAGMQISLKVGGNFVDIGPAGVSIMGTLVNINSGGAAGSGGGCSPTAPAAPESASPDEPDEADAEGKTGQKSSS